MKELKGLYYFRLMRGLTKKHTAKKIQVSYKKYSSMEAGLDEPTFQQYRILSNHFRVGLKMLISHNKEFIFKISSSSFYSEIMKAYELAMMVSRIQLLMEKIDFSKKP